MEALILYNQIYACCFCILLGFIGYQNPSVHYQHWLDFFRYSLYDIHIPTEYLGEGNIILIKVEEVMQDISRLHGEDMHTALVVERCENGEGNSDNEVVLFSNGAIITPTLIL